MSDASLGSLFESIYGTLYLGTVMSTAFYGVTCMQTFFYYVHYPDDPLLIKLFVAIFWALDTIHEALSISSTYKYIIAGLINPLSFVYGNPELVLVYFVTALVAIPTQGFFVYRMYLFSGRSIIAPLIWIILAFVQLVGITVYTVKALYTENGAVHVVDLTVLNRGIFQILGILCLSVAAGVDILIAIFMTFLLIRERMISRIAKTAHVLQLLTVFAVNTGIWTATFALVTILLLHIFPTKVLYAVFVIPLGSVYCNTLLANLNVRTYIRADRAFNPSVNLFTAPSSQAPDSISSGKPLGEARLASSAGETAVWKTTEVVRFPDVNLSFAAAENV